MMVSWTENAAGHLEGIRDYVARTSPRYAQALIDRIIGRTQLLGDMPMLGAEVSEYGDETIREVIEYPYRVIYQVMTDRVEVIAVIHGSRRLPRTPPR